jgi:hypothetical protein
MQFRQRTYIMSVASKKVCHRAMDRLRKIDWICFAILRFYKQKGPGCYDLYQNNQAVPRTDFHRSTMKRNRRYNW